MEFLIWFSFLLVCGALGMRGTRRKALQKRQDKALEFEVPNISGSAKFSTDADIRKGGLFSAKGIWLALSKFSGRVLRYAGDAHLLVVGPTGSGKARDLLVAIVLRLGPQTLIANDPKGQLLCVCHRTRRKVGPVYALNPFGIHQKRTKGVIHVRYNPLSILSADDQLLGIRCDKIADGLVWADADEKNRFWNDAAKELLSGLIMALVVHGKPEDQNLSKLCEVLCGDVYGYCRAVCAKTSNSYIRSRLGPYSAKRARLVRTNQDVVATARVHTQFVRNEVLGPSLASSDFTFKSLRDKPCSLFIVLPVDASADIYDRYYRLILACALAEMLSEECLGKTGVMFLIDEAGQLG